MSKAVSAEAARTLECRALSLAYGDTTILHDLTLAVAAGESVAVLGPSGAGKTSLLYAVAGFVPLSGGELLIGGRLAADRTVMRPPEERDVAIVFQHYALWPHMNALDTAAYPLRRRGAAPAIARRRAAELLELMGVGHLAERRPSELSGGEQQRVGVARALAREARLLLLDEPTAHLDAPLRAALMAEIGEQQRRQGAAALYATHDVGEALAVADRVALMRAGRLVQLGTPRQIYEQPANEWAARLTGSASLLEADIVAVDGTAGSMTVNLAGADAACRLPLPDGGEPARPGPVRLLVRPEWVALGGDLPGVVAKLWYRGPHTDYQLATAAGDIELRLVGPPQVAAGDSIGWRLERAWLVSPARTAARPSFFLGSDLGGDGDRRIDEHEVG